MALPVTLDMAGKVADFLPPPSWDPSSGPCSTGGDRTARPGLPPARQRRTRPAPRTSRPPPALDGSQGLPAVPARREYAPQVGTLAP